nr:unnamed protein product [Callosobruchus analis]
MDASNYIETIHHTTTEESIYCYQVDSVQHTFFECIHWKPERDRVDQVIGKVTPDNIVSKMLNSEENWEIVAKFTRQVIGRKERRHNGDGRRKEKKGKKESNKGELMEKH